MCLGGAGQSWGRGLVDRGLVEAPGGFVPGRPGAALLFWFFGGFGCGVPLFVVVLVSLNSILLINRHIQQDKDIYGTGSDRKLKAYINHLHLVVLVVY